MCFNRALKWEAGWLRTPCAMRRHDAIPRSREVLMSGDDALLKEARNWLASVDSSGAV
jgi:hypothetical protein